MAVHARRRVAIIGAGQSGTQLALGLQFYGYDVTVVTDGTPEDIRSGPVVSSQCMFGPALDVEDGADVPVWEDAPRIDSLDLRVTGDDPVRVTSPFGQPARSVDLRLKLSTWLDLFVQRGGNLVIAAASIAQIDEMAEDFDLVIVATGKGEPGTLFTEDPTRSTYTRPQRALALTYIRPDPARPANTSLRMSIAPGVGEFFTFPALTLEGECEILMFEGVLAGPMDRWSEVTTPAEHLTESKRILAEHFPDEAQRFAGAELIGADGVLRGQVRPGVRRPVGTLPSGRTVLGIGGAVVLTDPLTSQASNNAALGANFYLDAILRRGARDFDDAWKSRTFEAFWRGWASWSVALTNAMLEGITATQLRLMREAQTLPELATRIAGTFEDPRTSFRWWFDEAEADSIVVWARQESAAPFDVRELRNAFGQYATGVAVITGKDSSGKNVGITVNSFASVSLNPPMVLWCPSKTTPAFGAFQETDRFAVNVLRGDQHHLSRQFSAPADDKFREVATTPGIGDIPLIDGAVAQFECRIVTRHDAGDHEIHIGEIEAYTADGGDPLLFHEGRYHATRPHPDFAPRGTTVKAVPSTVSPAQTTVLNAPPVTVDPDWLTEAVTAVFVQEGLDHEPATRVSAALVEADLRGIPSHGVMLVPMYVGRIRAGSVTTRDEPELVWARGATAVLDAHHMLGQLSSDSASRLAADRALEHGLGAVGVRHAFHFGSAARYSEAMAARGLVGVAMSNTRPLMPAVGGAEPVVGNNPLAISVPGDETIAFTLDMALSEAALGKIRLAAAEGRDIPPTWATDADGNLTTDPRAAVEGLLLPTGGPKGFGLALVVDVLTGVLSGGGFGGKVNGLYADLTVPNDCAHFFFAIDPSHFGSPEDFVARVHHLTTAVSTSQPRAGVERLYLPGEMERERRGQAVQRGVRVEDSSLQALVELIPNGDRLSEIQLAVHA